MDKLAKELNLHHSQGKRYTYYPPVSTWNETSKVVTDFEVDKPWSLYVHLPFCRELCTFCGCNIKITKDEDEQIRYIDALISEFKQINTELPKGPFTLIIGGGSPNALSLRSLEKLSSFIKEEFPKPTDSLCEIDPRSFNQVQAEIFFELGIKRFSFGVQDFDQRVSKNVNREQSLEQLTNTAEILQTKASFGIDLLWGMPLQEESPFKQWFEGINALKPSWINYYPMAIVPWLEQVQNAYGDFTLPSQARKYELYSEGSHLIESCEYTCIGMGHFLHNESNLLKKFNNKELHRSVSGLFFNEQEQVLGLGVSAISRTSKSQWQNQKILDRYLFLVGKARSPIAKVHENREEDRTMGQYISDIILERPNQKIEELDIPDEWTSKSEDSSLSKVSIHGRHFKKNILQVLENDLFSK